MFVNKLENHHRVNITYLYFLGFVFSFNEQLITVFSTIDPYWLLTRTMSKCKEAGFSQAHTYCTLLWLF